MAKPILSAESAYAFDATTSKIFTYRWASDQSQSVGNILRIRNNANNTTVYEEQISTLKLQHELPANILTNGTTYNVSIAVVCSNGTTSDYSDTVLFTCYSTPSFSVSINSNQVVESSSIPVYISYNQSEGEQLQYFTLYLYDSNKNIIDRSGTKYDIDSSFSFGNLQDNTAYYVSASGQTVNHMSISTDLIPFTVDYITPTYYSLVTAENVKDGGYVQISCHLVSVEGTTDGEPIYIDDEYVDTKNGPNVRFDEGFIISNDFTICASGYGFLQNELLMKAMNKSGNSVQIWIRKGKYDVNDDSEKWFIELRSGSETVYCTNLSNYFDYSQGDTLYIWIKRKNNYYAVHVAK